MMDVTIKGEHVGDYYISITIEVIYNRNVYHVMCCKDFGGYCGHPIRERYAPTEESAKRTYSYYKRVCKG